MGKKLTTEEFIEKANKVHGNKYDYSLVKYVGCKDKVEIICKEHGIFKQSPRHHLAGRNCYFCVKGKRKLGKTLFIEKSNLIHKYEYVYDNVIYVNNSTKVEILCKIHGCFYQTPSSHLSGSGCPKCYGEIPYTYDTLSKAVTMKHNGAIELLEGQIISGCSYKYKFKHINCGNVWESLPQNILKGKGCPNCHSTAPLSFQSLSEKINKKHKGEIELIPDQNIIGSKNKYKFKHRLCGNVWETLPSIILTGHGCPKCAVYGFNPDKSATFYILKIKGDSEFIGFGVSNKYEQRKSQHNKNLKVNNCTITAEILIHSDGKTIQELECYIKKTLQCKNSHIVGFRTESLLISPEDLLDFCTKRLTEQKAIYKIESNSS